MTIGLVAAMPAELKCLNGRTYSLNQPFKISDRLLAIISGIGANHAKRATELLQYHKVNGIISWGVAASLSKADPGDLLLPETVISKNGRQFQTDRAWREQLIAQLQNIPGRIHTEPMTETRLILESVQQKQSLYNETGAIAADMESATIARVAVDNHLPCLVVRTVADHYDQVLPYAITRHTDVYGNPNITKILVEVLLKPRLLSQAMQLARAMNKALATLKIVARQGHNALDTFY